MGFDEAYADTAAFEGGYSNNPKDAGGPTNFGITEQVARANGYAGDMKAIPKDQAEAIAKKQYWDVLRLDEISALSEPIAAELFDTGFNAGPGTAGKFLQRALNVLNREGKEYGDVTVDGLLGAVTVDALRTYLNKRGQTGEMVLLRALNCLQGAYYVEIAEKRSANEEFVYGWLLNRVALG